MRIPTTASQWPLVALVTISSLNLVIALRTSNPVGSFDVSGLSIPIIDPAADDDIVQQTAWSGTIDAAREGQDLTWTKPWKAGRGAVKQALQPYQGIGYAWVYDITFKTEGPTCQGRCVIRDADTKEELFRGTTGFDCTNWRSAQTRNVQLAFYRYTNLFFDIQIGCGTVSYTVSPSLKKFRFGHDLDMKTEEHNELYEGLYQASVDHDLNSLGV